MFVGPNWFANDKLSSTTWVSKRHGATFSKSLIRILKYFQPQCILNHAIFKVLNGRHTVFNYHTSLQFSFYAACQTSHKDMDLALAWSVGDGKQILSPATDNNLEGVLIATGGARTLLGYP